MKYKITLVCFFLSAAIFSQERMESEQIQALRVSYITTELALTPAEAEKFWPIYNAFKSKEREVRRGRLMLNRRLRINELTEKEAIKVLSDVEKGEEELFENRKALMVKLKQTLPAVKILKLKRAEDDFNRQLLKKYRNKKE